MIAPGQMPSRPRPLPRRRSLFTLRVPRRRTRQRATTTGSVRAPSDGACAFRLGPVALPVATLRPGAWQARHRVLGGHVQRWLAMQWAWLRPRTLPMIVALAGMFAVLGATRYLSALARGEHQTARFHAATPASHHAPARPAHDVTITLGR